MWYVFFRNKKAFTLLEILIVISIVGIITAASVVPYNNFVKRSRDTRRKVDIEQLRAALELYKSNNDSGLYPNVLSLLAPNYIKAVPTDPQDKSYSYSCITPTDCSDYQLSIPLESGVVYLVQAGSTTTIFPTDVITVAPTSIINPTSTPIPTVIACTKKQIGQACNFSSECCSEYCDTSGSQKDVEVLGISHSRGMLAAIDDPDPPTNGVCAKAPVEEISIPTATATPSPTRTPSPSPTTVPSPTPIPCPLGGIYECNTFGCRCEHTSCVNNSCVKTIGDAPSQCILGTDCKGIDF